MPHAEAAGMAITPGIRVARSAGEHVEGEEASQARHGVIPLECAVCPFERWL